MKTEFLYWFFRLTGGRPMRRLGLVFVPGNAILVYAFRDAFGREWLATSEWALFRVHRYAKTDPMYTDPLDLE